MEQGQQARAPEQAGVGVEERARVEAGWAARMPLDRAEIASVQAAAQRPYILQGSLVIKEVVLSVVRK
ncbi:MAG TPA: hypothetical protein HPP87_13180 [Planctomycetes bacterium]|nr:hypothetical protein [Planctomycetota bacterium]